jgi:uncharacterized protein (TIGR03435 family)
MRPVVGEVQGSGIWRSTFITVVGLTRYAYPGHAFPGQVVGGPAWSSADLYDIEARAAAASTPEQLHDMTKTLLAERFRMSLHPEMRELPAYKLVLARSDRRLGPGLAAPNPKCNQPGETSCDVRRSPVPGPDTSDWRVTAGNAPVASIIPILGRELGRPVVDRTGLTQGLSITLRYTPTSARANAEPGVAIRSALSEQLGLRIEDDRAAVEVLVIDRIERPTEN